MIKFMKHIFLSNPKKLHTFALGNKCKIYAMWHRNGHTIVLTKTLFWLGELDGIS
jgi:hypothetical protein